MPLASGELGVEFADHEPDIGYPGGELRFGHPLDTARKLVYCLRDPLDRVPLDRTHRRMIADSRPRAQAVVRLPRLSWRFLVFLTGRG
jgi:hypothetical protein